MRILSEKMIQGSFSFKFSILSLNLIPKQSPVSYHFNNRLSAENINLKITMPFQRSS